MGFFSRFKKFIKDPSLSAVKDEIASYDPTTTAGREKLAQNAGALAFAPVTGGVSLLAGTGGPLDIRQLKTPGIPDPGAPPVPADYSDQAIRDIQKMQKLASRGRLGLRSTFRTGPQGAYAPPAIPRRMTGV